MLRIIFLWHYRKRVYQFYRIKLFGENWWILTIENKFLRIIFIFLLVLLVLFLGKADTLKIALVGVLLLSVIVVTNVELALIILVFSGYTFNFAVEVYHCPGR